MAAHWRRHIEDTCLPDTSRWHGKVTAYTSTRPSLHKIDRSVHWPTNTYRRSRTLSAVRALPKWQCTNPRLVVEGKIIGNKALEGRTVHSDRRNRRSKKKAMTDKSHRP